ncbi:hypothetical protein PHYSODRAFT_497478 [Phytophthora sojae]|uniref:BZIP domain-containing protein n=1 Tax=Phytophthora sojae (strain P6497) TaxID=1094619 RepID=G4ZBG7_PHYSP|nr:hypothetical protein PHYSODRAFT_497478 [Phytophthora sojae]EGZ19889.1 hypothetical protein PHYSODRAFT_497478 [Phytophthora sojae]|eukprot:XP_009522606.1 hypothetical protein PHYSODRAFT_497478 [Phytophthora sojae]
MLGSSYEPLEPSGPPLSPSMERAFSEAFADEVELDDLSDIDASTSLRLATPPSPVSNSQVEVSPSRSNVVPSAKNSAEAKRARRSEIEKKSRLRRLDIINRMRDELQRKYSELTLVAQELEKDQAAIRRLLQEHEFYQRYARNMSSEDAFAIWDSGIPSSLSFAARFRHLSTSECYEFARKTYEEIRKFTDCEIVESTRSSFMGWTDQHKHYRNTETLLFAFTKQFPSENVEELFNKTWDMFLSGSQLEKMVFDSPTRTRLQVLQVLNDDLFIVRRDYRPSRLQLTLTSIQLMFRLQTPTGYTFCRRTISSPEIENLLEPHEYLVDTFHWVHFNRLYDQYDNPAGWEVVHGGSIGHHERLRSNYWLFEMVCSVLRWESSMISPLVLLQTEEKWEDH